MSSLECSPRSSSPVDYPSTPASEADWSYDVDGINDILFTSRQNQYVLITGGLGFIGSHTSVQIMKEGYNVIIVDDNSNSRLDALDGILTIADLYYEKLTHRKCPKIELHSISYRNTPAMRAIFDSHSYTSPGGQIKRSNIVGVIHFAAYKAVEESIRKPLQYYQNNINGLVDFLELLDEVSVKTVIFSSSAAVYGSLAGSLNGPLREENCVQQCEEGREQARCEDLPQSGCKSITNPYGRSKFFGEAILSDLVLSDPSWNIVALRYFNPVGCDASGLLGEAPRGLPSNLLPVVTQVVTSQREQVKIFGGDWDTIDGSAIRDFIHVTDLARGHISALSACRSGRISGGYRTYNLGVGKGNTVLEVVRAMEAASGCTIPYEIVDKRAGDVERSVADVDRSRTELGWETKETLESACRDICNRLQTTTPELLRRNATF
ncbi:hypothetical protein BKA67DRAFT_527231 [Truncatella angustata]|uniref:NAD-dependent epimerase/dehydratase domain-containing protein n=1 Tax=Truncatella angustata TaxID=152316 RepID=A0A9P8UC71_9PEZI|nr:uncharacterized protein BKA67DRAFT_527231 [Truncatella angustata]KAH6645412.1 hypothetical protein BKA67DRAFT_527231 [Truncatella angustata]